MSVFENMAFGLKLRKMPTEEIKRRVDAAAELLEIRDYLGRKPRALSGGQRQRVAMGRAIVREPKAFLMDEPLSNLDAKLRVVMRTELALLHERLGTTTVYVTHDQVEAMTLGERVAVLKPLSERRRETLQQVAPPALLFNEPANLFVAGFIGSPAMNLVTAVIEGSGTEVDIVFGGIRLRVDPRALQRTPGLAAFAGKEVIAGIRPGDFEHEAAARDAGPKVTMEADVEVIEVLGSESYVHFPVAAPPVMTPDIEELLADTGADKEILLDEMSMFTARISPDVSVDPPERITLVVETAKLHFFDPSTGDRIR
jgi:multiple sugar transport system ATP-binding protein